MDYLEKCNETEGNDPVIVKADEVDEAGADISTIVPNDSTDAEFNKRIETRRTQDAEGVGSPKTLANAVPSPPKWWARPGLRRNGSAVPPPHHPSDPPQQREEPAKPTDSLSLLQLKRLVTDLPKFEPTAYAYEYQDTRAFPEELEEWFQYTEEDKYTLLRAKHTFEEKWRQSQVIGGEGLGWTSVKQPDREYFVVGAINALTSSEILIRVRVLECLSYIVLGAWSETAGLRGEFPPRNSGESITKDLNGRYGRSTVQLDWIRDGANLLCEKGAVPLLFHQLKRVCELDECVSPLLAPLIAKLHSPSRDLALLIAIGHRDTCDSADDDGVDGDGSISPRLLVQIEINQTLTILYTIVEVGRWIDGEDGDPKIRQAFETVGVDLLSLLTQVIAKLRWEESSILPLPRVLLLFWKTLLLVFGSTKDLTKCKGILRDDADQKLGEHGEDIITASPLDYHLFRQEITSKYPSYSPPPPLVPIELENNSILPPLPSHPSRRASQETLYTRVGPRITGAGSIFNQAVHIATPAPSPPPSPAGPGGKGAKKQNFQTNQNFPFLYPPLDDSSNILGGKGKAELKDQLVRRRWEGSDVPASILEAGQLFASRMRMSRSIRQLWDVREKFIQFERGWNGRDDSNGETESVHSGCNDDEPDILFEEEGRTQKEPKRERETQDESVQRRLDAVEKYYHDCLPHLQSLAIVFWKITVANVSTLVSPANGPNGIPSSFSFVEDNADAQGKRRGNTNPANGLANGQASESPEGAAELAEELNVIRAREITSKAVSGALLMLLKWFKISHILKFEYLTQLLLDANYIPLILKLFVLQDIDRAVEQRNDKANLDFFHFCQTNSKHPPSPTAETPLSPSSSSEDEAVPPPIRRNRESPPPKTPPPTRVSPPLTQAPTPQHSSPPQQPEVDELGYPTTALPSSPLTTFSPRFFFTTITLLRLLQKITKRKAHRALLLVQYKSSTALRRALKIPQPQLRLYTLKLFKSQVPYCGRKWRQTNMRVITAVYLHCRPELRDEWLCGGDVDGVVEEALPLEQAGRSLVHWWHLRRYKDVVDGKTSSDNGVVVGKEEEGDDGGNFFERELERMGWGITGVSTGDEDDSGGGGPEWDGGLPMHLGGGEWNST